MRQRQHTPTKFVYLDEITDRKKNDIEAAGKPKCSVGTEMAYEAATYSGDVVRG
jgi:hypothetical protein